jgi:hypothetical protein
MNSVCVGSCSNAAKDGLETDVDCGGGFCAKCKIGKACAKGSDCTTGVCLSGVCRPHTCLEAKQENANAASGDWVIAPDGLSTFHTFCDMGADGGGWAWVSYNGNVASLGTCQFRMKSDAPSCGGGGSNVPAPSTDWQLAGSDMNKLTFSDIMLVAWNPNLNSFAVTKLTLNAPRTVGNGVMTVTPSIPFGLNSELRCSGYGTFANRTHVAVTSLGYTVWGEDAGNNACGLTTGGIIYNMGLFVPNDNGSHDTFGWDDDNNNCGCADTFFPGDATTRQGWYMVR